MSIPNVWNSWPRSRSANPNTPGLIQPDGTTILVSPSGILSAPGAGFVTHTGPLTADLPMFGNGSADSKVGTKSGNTDEVATVSGAVTSGHLATWDANGNLVDGGVPAAGSVTAVTGTPPIASSGGATPAISVAVATTLAVGVVKPDGTSITIDGAGKISAASISLQDGMYQFASSNASIVTLGSLPFQFPNGSGTVFSSAENSRQCVIGVPTTLKNLVVKLTNQNIGAAATLTITLRVNGVDTAITCTIPAGGTTASNTTDSVNVGSGDLISYKFSTTGTTVTTSAITITLAGRS